MFDIRDAINRFINNRKVLILGYGKEGRSTYRVLRSYFPKLEICISDINTDISSEDELQKDSYLSWVLGEGHMKALANYELIFKSPGISFKTYQVPAMQQISSQTDLFLELFHQQIIGVTGTKGKSTTVSLIQHLLKSADKKVLLVGNIGLPALEVISDIEDDTVIVYELSSHQLEFTTHSPHIAVFLNLYEEHLDHYTSFLDYQKAKGNIINFQLEGDYLIYYSDDILISERLVESGSEAILLPFCHSDKKDCSRVNKEYIVLKNGKKFSFDFSKMALLGNHNILNVLAAINVCMALSMNIQEAINNLESFKPLPHRLEDVGIHHGIRFINDSIATIPEASIKAINTFADLDILILGGFNRGIDYSVLIDFLLDRELSHIILLGKVGGLIRELLVEENYKLPLYDAKNMDEVVKIAYNVGKEGSICLLSPAASSYDCFHNFEDRGDQYKKKVQEKASHL
ncbi:MAG: UDP-N-acetylmuramoyl-L-alanine--D-glutamate ligase [Bacteroidetes bacterium]|nr:MAG: UDP-N-acetylmuramoyl-L-alanine--D-glutamate ligase [Bacteroidota bacterium]